MNKFKVGDVWVNDDQIFYEIIDVKEDHPFPVIAKVLYLYGCTVHDSPLRLIVRESWLSSGSLLKYKCISIDEYYKKQASKGRSTYKGF